MDLETVIHSEVSQKEKNEYRILTHICGIQKNGTDEAVCKAEVETQMQRTNVWTPRGESLGGGGMNWEIGMDIYTPIFIKQITNENLLYSTRNSTSLLQQKLTQHCKKTIPQLKKKNVATFLGYSRGGDRHSSRIQKVLSEGRGESLSHFSYENRKISQKGCPSVTC